MRPLRPVPLTSSSGTPSSRANLRTEGEAWGRPSAGVAVGMWAGAAAALATAAAGAGAAAAGAEAAAGAGAAQLLRSRHGAFQNRQQVANVDFVTELDLEFLDHTRGARRDFHRGLVGLHGDQALLDLDGVAHLDHDLDHGHVLEVTNVGHAHLDRAARRTAGAGAAAGAATAAAATADSAAGAAGAGAAASPATSSISTSEPCFTLSPRRP